jgi:hypothetical protein
VALYLAACFAVGALPSTWIVFLMWAFTAMVHPELEGHERTQEIVERLFFREGWGHGALLIAMTWTSATCLVATAMNLFIAIARFPSFRTSAVFTCVAGTVLAILAFAALIRLA